MPSRVEEFQQKYGGISLEDYELQKKNKGGVPPTERSLSVASTERQNQRSKDKTLSRTKRMREPRKTLDRERAQQERMNLAKTMHDTPLAIADIYSEQGLPLPEEAWITGSVSNLENLGKDHHPHDLDIALPIPPSIIGDEEAQERVLDMIRSRAHFSDPYFVSSEDMEMLQKGKDPLGGEGTPLRLNIQPAKKEQAA